MIDLLLGEMLTSFTVLLAIYAVPLIAWRRDVLVWFALVGAVLVLGTWFVWRTAEGDSFGADVIRGVLLGFSIPYGLGVAVRAAMFVVRSRRPNAALWPIPVAGAIVLGIAFLWRFGAL